jgi:hypothetical protein
MCSVMDLAVLRRHLAASATDPFNGRPLRLDDVEPVPELRDAIQRWRHTLPDARRDVSIAVSQEALDRIGGEALTPELMAALLEAEALKLAAARAHQDALMASSAAAQRRRRRGEEHLGVRALRRLQPVVICRGVPM